MPAEPIDVTGSAFSWRACREAQALPVLLLHGLTGSRWSWETQLIGLSEGGRSVFAWDAPGYGDSAPLEERTFPALARAVVRWADELGAERFHLVGLSFGGMISQYVASESSSRLASVSLLATSPKFGFDGVTSPESWRAARLAALDAGQHPRDFAPTVLRSIAGPVIDEDALAGQIRAAELVHPDALRAAIDVLVTHDSRALLPSITVPTLCLVGALDVETPVSYAAAIASAIPGARLITVPDAGHLLNAEAPGAVNGLLLRHFAAHE